MFTKNTCLIRLCFLLQNYTKNIIRKGLLIEKRTIM